MKTDGIQSLFGIRS